MNNEETYEDITEVIQHLGALRRSMGISQTELSERSGVPQKTISRMESGKTIPTFKTINSIASILGLAITINVSSI